MTPINTEPIYVVLSRERADGNDAPWGLDFQVPIDYLQDGISWHFNQVFGFHFNGKEDADVLMNNLARHYDNLEFKIAEVSICLK